MFEIRFGKSVSKNYKKAINRARKIPGFVESEDEDDNTNVVTVDENDLKRHHKTIESLWELIGSWKSTSIEVNGKEMDFYNLREYLAVLQCNDEYKKAVVPERHCDVSMHEVGWGCRFLNTIQCSIPSNTWDYERNRFWFQLGSFDKKGIWNINKDKLLQALEQETANKHLSICSVFDIKRVKKVLQNLPDSIDVEKSDKWTYETREIMEGGAYTQKRVGVKPMLDNNDSDYRFGIRLDLDSEEEEEKENEQNRYIPTVKFSDIGGIDDIIDTIREVIELPIKQPKLFEYMGIKPHKGILLYGHPGCGKTMVAKAIANEINAHFISIKGPELFNKYVGQSEENLRNVFEEARKLQPSVIYFDEIDSIAATRSGSEHVRHESIMVNQLLTLMDGVEDYNNVCVIASTNRPEILDEAVKRPGRFDYSIEIKKPTKEGCEKIFRISTKNMPVDPKFDYHSFCNNLHGLSGADIAFVAKEGAYNCLRRNIDLKKIIVGNKEIPSNFEQYVVTEADFSLAFKKLSSSHTDSD